MRLKNLKKLLYIYYKIINFIANLLKLEKKLRYIAII